MSAWSRTRLAAALTIAMLAAITAAPGAVAAARPRVSIPQMYQDLMCVVCHESLAIAQSPESFQERQEVRTLVGQGLDRAQVEHAMVAQYGTAVLARPPAHGFNLLVYVIPPVVVLIGLGTLVVTIPRWRRRSRAQRSAGAATGPPTLSDADTQRIDQELAERF